MDWLNVLLWLTAAVLSVPMVVVCVELFMAMISRRSTPTGFAGPRPRVAVLIPAHNEGALVRTSVESAARQLQAGDRLIVIADNCSDDTADHARAAGAECIIRNDTTKRGKGYALDFGVRHLAEAPPAYVVLLDADVSLRPGAIDELTFSVESTWAPAQGVYILAEPPSPDGAGVVSHLAFVVRNHVRPLGLSRIGGPSPLFGAGMAFPYDALRDAPLASGNIVEDMQLALDLAQRGRAPRFCPTAYIDGVLPTGEDAALTQRRRWEHGHLRTLLTTAPRVLFKGLMKLNLRAVLLALDLLVPPLSFLLVLALLAFIGLLVPAVLGRASYAPAATVAIGLATLSLLITLAWTRYSPHERPIAALLGVPRYVLRKLPLYFAFFTRGSEKQWVRTDRN